MEPKRRERLLQRVQERKRSYDSCIPSLPTPPSYYIPETEYILDDDEIIGVLERLPWNFQSHWRRGSIEMATMEPPIQLYRMTQSHQKALLRNRGDGTACGKVWAAGLVFPLFSIATHSPIHRILKEWTKGGFVVEVGAGWSGTAGITAYRMGASSVALTDGEEVMVECLGVNAAAEVNIQQGCHAKISASPRPNSVYPVTEEDQDKLSGRWSSRSDLVELNSPLTAHRLIWGKREDAEEIYRTTGNGGPERKCDLAIGCDCIHDANAVENLLVTISNYLKCDRIFLCWESTWMRMDGEELFMRRMMDYGYHLRYYSASVLADLALLHDENIDRISEEIRSTYLESPDSELNVLAVERNHKSAVVSAPPAPPAEIRK